MHFYKVASLPQKGSRLHITTGSGSPRMSKKTSTVWTREQTRDMAQALREHPTFTQHSLKSGFQAMLAQFKSGDSIKSTDFLARLFKGERLRYLMKSNRMSTNQVSKSL